VGNAGVREDDEQDGERTQPLDVWSEMRGRTPERYLWLEGLGVLHF
jgi:hypothetical protein